MQLYSSIESADIWTRAGTRAKYHQFPLVILGYSVDTGYFMLPRMQKIIGSEGIMIGLQKSKSHIFGLELNRDN